MRLGRVFPFAALALCLSCGAAAAPGVEGERGASRGGVVDKEKETVEPPSSYEETAAIAGEATDEERAAARALFENVNAERTARGLHALTWSDELSVVGRNYCAEMARTGVIAHESKLSGSPADRARKAGIAFVRLTENLALAGDAAAAHEGLMNSQGHKANILDSGVFAVGIGTLRTVRDGVPSLFVTQMFAAFPEEIDPDTADDVLADRLNDARRKLGIAKLVRHEWLDARAKEALRSCGAGAISQKSRAEKNPPFRVLTAVLVQGGTIAQLAEGFAENRHARSRALTHFGVAATRIDESAGGICAVVMFGSKE